MFRWGVLLFFLFTVTMLTACYRPLPLSTAPPTATVTAAGEVATAVVIPPSPVPQVTLPPTPTLAPTTSPIPTATAAPPTITPTPLISDSVTACGQILPILPAEVARQETITVDPLLLNRIRTRMPSAAQPAFDELLTDPAHVGLVAFQVGNEANGVYLNPDAPMPLASVIKIVYLVAYAEAVASGELDPLTAVPLADLEAFYQPRLDLGAHEQSIEDLTASGRIYGTPPLVSLEAVPTMMMRYSSNAAMDYLHLLLGQERIEATAVALGLTSQTAPCPFLGQFLAMNNFTRVETNDETAVINYINNPDLYGREAMELTLAYSSDADFRQTQISWRQESRRPNVATQRLFSDNLNPQASPRDYANLMARIAINGLADSEASFLTRRYLEWPMMYTVNQELFTNIGYKNGSLPGILTITYYAYPLDSLTPTVVTLFYRDLQMRTYNLWRRTSLAHDEFARWLLADPEAIPLLSQLLHADNSP